MWISGELFWGFASRFCGIQRCRCTHGCGTKLPSNSEHEHDWMPVCAWSLFPTFGASLTVSHPSEPTSCSTTRRDRRQGISMREQQGSTKWRNTLECLPAGGGVKWKQPFFGRTRFQQFQTPFWALGAICPSKSREFSGESLDMEDPEFDLLMVFGTANRWRSFFPLREAFPRRWPWRRRLPARRRQLGSQSVRGQGLSKILKNTHLLTYCKSSCFFFSSFASKKGHELLAFHLCVWLLW